MTINTVIDYINKKYNLDVSADYYKNVDLWKRWWKGYDADFHRFKETASDGTQINRTLSRMKMAKKVCEDWAAILLNEATEIVINDDAASTFLFGRHEGTAEDKDGVLEECDFWNEANILIEKAFATGTGAFVCHLNGMSITDDGKLNSDESTGVSIDYLTAEHIIPISQKRGKLTEAAFWSEDVVRGKTTVYLELHLLESGTYKIENHFFEEKNGGLKEIDLPDNIAEVIYTGTDVPFFSIIRPNIANNIDERTALGISVYADAIDILKGVDLAYNNLNKDFKLGGKKVFLNSRMVRYDDQTGQQITPDDVAQQLFVTTGDGLVDNDGKKMIEEFNPSLRVAENKDGIQGQLDYLSFKCGFGTKHYQFNAGQIVTATQYTGDKQELLQNASKHYITVTASLKQLMRSLLWIGKNVCGVPLNESAEITIKYDDSYVTDKETERLRDREEVDRGIMQKWEYRMKWYGEDEETAKSMTKVEGIGSFFMEE